MVSEKKILMPLAQDMPTLLAALKDVPFQSYQDAIHPEERTTSDRSESLSTLMQILMDQAEQDGFRMITINTEPKRVIMACNRQGKPPNWNKNDEEEQQHKKEEEEESDDKKQKKTGRWGTSIRCQCRMRVNINFHTKLNAWRITSYESQHNHSFGKRKTSTEQEKEHKEPFQITSKMVERAIQKYRQMNTPQLSLEIMRYAKENDAAMALAHLKSPRSPQSDSKRLLLTGETSPSKQTPPSIQISPATTAETSEIQREPQSAHPQRRPSRIFVFRRRPSLGKLAPPAPLSAGILPSHSQQQQQQQMLSSPTGQQLFPFSTQKRAEQQAIEIQKQQQQQIKNMAATAIEVDRYAMLHSSFKRLIATACKKREWTEEMLTGVGRLVEKLGALGAPVSPLDTSSFRSQLEQVELQKAGQETNEHIMKKRRMSEGIVNELPPLKLPLMKRKEMSQPNFSSQQLKSPSPPSNENNLDAKRKSLSSVSSFLPSSSNRDNEMSSLLRSLTQESNQNAHHKS